MFEDLPLHEIDARHRRARWVGGLGVLLMLSLLGYGDLVAVLLFDLPPPPWGLAFFESASQGMATPGTALAITQTWPGWRVAPSGAALNLLPAALGVLGLVLTETARRAEHRALRDLGAWLSDPFPDDITAEPRAAVLFRYRRHQRHLRRRARLAATLKAGLALVALVYAGRQVQITGAIAPEEIALPLGVALLLVLSAIAGRR